MISHFLTASMVSSGDPGVIRTLDTRLRRNDYCFFSVLFAIYSVFCYLPCYI